MNNRFNWAYKIYLLVSDVTLINVSAIRLGVPISIVLQSHSYCGAISGTDIQIVQNMIALLYKIVQKILPLLKENLYVFALFFIFYGVSQ